MIQRCGRNNPHPAAHLVGVNLQEQLLEEIAALEARKVVPIHELVHLLLRAHEEAAADVPVRDRLHTPHKQRSVKGNGPPQRSLEEGGGRSTFSSDARTTLGMLICRGDDSATKLRSKARAV